MAFLLFRALRGEQLENAPESVTTEEPSAWETLCAKAFEQADQAEKPAQNLGVIVDWYHDFEKLRAQINPALQTWLKQLTLKGAETSHSQTEAEIAAAHIYMARHASRQHLARLPKMITSMAPSISSEGSRNSSSPFSTRARILHYVQTELKTTLVMLLRDVIGYILVNHANWINNDLEAIQLLAAGGGDEPFAEPSCVHLLTAFLRRPPAFVPPAMLTMPALKQAIIEERESLKVSLTECLDVVSGLYTTISDSALEASDDSGSVGIEFIKCLEAASNEGKILLDLLQHGGIESILDLFAPIHDALSLLHLLTDPDWCDGERRHRLAGLKSQIVDMTCSTKASRPSGVNDLMKTLEESESAAAQILSFYRLLDETTDIDERSRAMISTLKEDVILLFINCLLHGSPRLLERLSPTLPILVSRLEKECDSFRAALMGAFKAPRQNAIDRAPTLNVLHRSVLETLSYLAASPNRNLLVPLASRITALFCAWIVNEGERFHLMDVITKAAGESSPVCDDFWIEKTGLSSAPAHYEDLAAWALLMRSLAAGDSSHSAAKGLPMLATLSLMLTYLEASGTQCAIAEVLAMEIFAFNVTSSEAFELTKTIGETLQPRDSHLISLIRPASQALLSLPIVDLLFSIALSPSPFANSMLQTIRTVSLVNESFRSYIAGRILQPDIESLSDSGNVYSVGWPSRCVSALKDNESRQLLPNVTELLKAIILPGTPIESELRAALVQVKLMSDKETGVSTRSFSDALIEICISELTQSSPATSRLKDVLILFLSWMCATRRVEPLDRSEAITHQQNIQEARRARRAPVSVWENFHFDKSILLNAPGLRMMELIAQMVIRNEDSGVEDCLGMAAYFFVGLLGRALQLTEFLEICPISEIYEVFTSAEMVFLASSVSRLHMCVTSNEMSRILAAAGDFQRSLTRHNKLVDTGVLASEWVEGGKLYEQFLSQLLWIVEGVPLSCRSAKSRRLTWELDIEWSVLRLITSGATDRLLLTSLAHRVNAFKGLIQATAFASSARPLEIAERPSGLESNADLASAIEQLQKQVGSLCTRLENQHRPATESNQDQLKTEIASTPPQDLVAIVGYLVSRVAELEDEVVRLRGELQEKSSSRAQEMPLSGQSREADVSPFETPAVLFPRQAMMEVDSPEEFVNGKAAMMEVDSPEVEFSGEQESKKLFGDEQNLLPSSPMEDDDTLVTDPFSSADPLRDLPRLSELPSLMPDLILEEAHRLAFQTPDTAQAPPVQPDLEDGGALGVQQPILLDDEEDGSVVHKNVEQGAGDARMYQFVAADVTGGGDLPRWSPVASEEVDVETLLQDQPPRWDLPLPDESILWQRFLES